MRINKECSSVKTNRKREIGEKLKARSRRNIKYRLLKFHKNKQKEKRKKDSSIMMKVSVNTKVKSHVKCIIWCLVFTSMSTRTEAGSCREASLCCNGRDSSCVVQKTAINVINEDPNEKPCYCDHACLKLGDCCEDFKSNCGGK